MGTFSIFHDLVQGICRGFGFTANGYMISMDLYRAAIEVENQQTISVRADGRSLAGSGRVTESDRERWPESSQARWKESDQERWPEISRARREESGREREGRPPLTAFGRVLVGRGPEVKSRQSPGGIPGGVRGVFLVRLQ